MEPVSYTHLVKGHTFLDIVLEEDAVELDKVVVTALGIEKKGHSLSYAMSQVKSEELTRVKMPNLITSLTCLLYTSRCV